MFARTSFQAVSGGRYVQTTSSSHLEHGWRDWQLVHINGIDPNEVDIYFFAVQPNPVDEQSLVAIFPLTHPPAACVMIAFSLDGISFSRPVNLRSSVLGVRPAATLGSKRGDQKRLEWRGEDHPAAGIVRMPNDTSKLIFYVHHAVRGTTVRKSAIAHLRAYQLEASELRRLTHLALDQNNSWSPSNLA
jgi:hypothetical protein